jgi:EpsI family protein
MTEKTFPSDDWPGLRAGTRREILIGSGFVAAAAIAFARKPRTSLQFLGKGKLEDLVPKSFMGWQMVGSSGLVLPPQDQLSDKLYSQLLTRTYTNAAGEQAMLLIAYSPDQDGVVQVHRPEICYPASGFKLTAVDDHETRLSPNLSVPSRHIVAETGARREEIIYWTRFGNDFPRRWSEQRSAIFWQNLRGFIPDGVLVRISSVMPNSSVVSLDGFASALYSSVGPGMQHTLAGEQKPI